MPLDCAFSSSSNTNLNKSPSKHVVDPHDAHSLKAERKTTQKNVQLLYLPDTENSNEVVNSRHWCCCVFLDVFFFSQQKSHKKDEKRIANCSFSTPRFVYEYLWWNGIGKHMTTRHHAKQAQKQKARRLLIVSQTEAEGRGPNRSSIPQFLSNEQWDGIFLLMVMSDQGRPMLDVKVKSAVLKSLILMTFCLTLIIAGTVNDWSFVHEAVAAYVQLRIRSLLQRRCW